MTDTTQIPPDEDDAVHLATEGDPNRSPDPDPDAFTDDKEQDDPEDAS